MGTRRSKHNQGRKPGYKDARRTKVEKAIWDQPDFSSAEPSVSEVLATPAFPEIVPGQRWRLNQRLNWTPADEARLRILAKAGIDPITAADTLGRDEKTIAYRARDIAISIPESWVKYLPKAKYIARPRQPKILLNYPFAIHVKRDEHADLIAVNNIVPKGIPDHMRGDICQDILLAIYEGKVNIETLKKSPKLVREYMNRWRNNNLECGGYAVSLDPFGDEERSFEEQVAARTDWDYNQLNDMRSNFEAQSLTHTPATQFNDLWNKEVHLENVYRSDAGENITYEETADLMDRGERIHKKINLVNARIKIANCLKECGFIFDFKAMSPAYKGETIYRISQNDTISNPQFNTQRITFKIPDSAIPPLMIRISNHHQKNTGPEIILDTYKLSVDGVIKVLKELANNTEELDAIHRKTGDFYDVMQEIAA